MDLTERVRTAHGDAWQAEGRLRRPFGGGALELPGIRLMASGIPTPAWNNGDVTDPDLVELDQVRSWYAELGVPWGVRVPAGMPWPHGRHLFAKRCMALRAVDLVVPDPPAGLTLEPARPDDLEDVAHVDAEAFDANLGETRRWAAPHIGADGFLSVLARLNGEPVGVASGVRSSGAGGESVGVNGVGVLAPARGRGVGSSLTAYVVAWGLSTGADLAWLNPDGEAEVRLYGRLGFVETGGFDIYVDM